MKSRWLDIAMQLLALPTAPLCEDAIIAWLRRFADERGIAVEADRAGNLLMRYRRGPRRRPIAFCAHMDHPGFRAERMLSATRADGSGKADRGRPPFRLMAQWRGYVPPHLFPGAKVRFFSGGRWVKGVVIRSAKKHVMGESRPTLIEIAAPVEPGSVGMWDFGEPRLAGSRLYARGHDDISGVAAIACALDEAHRRKLPGEFLAFFTRAEESGMLGAIAACRCRTLPKDAIVVALETSRALPVAPLGGGVVVRVGDRQSIFDPGVTDWMWSACRSLASADASFKSQRKLMDGGVCESSVYLSYGYRAGGLCVPLGNYHNVDWDRDKLGPEYIDVNDYAALVRLLLELARIGPDLGGGAIANEKWNALYEAHGRDLP